MAGYGRRSGRTQSRPQALVRQPAEGRGQGSGVGGRNQQPIHAVPNDLAQPPDVRGDDRRAAGQGLHGGEPERLPA